MIKTAESVKRGHPDKICDQISDAILDECLKEDANSRVAAETMGGHGKIYICGEITTKANLDFKKIAKNVYKDAGYDPYSVEVIDNIVVQSPDIAMGVDTGGAGDQGIMVGYACGKNHGMIPHELYIARKITMMLEDLSLQKGLKNGGILPDGKAQVTLDENDKIITMVISNQTRDEKYLKDILYEKIFVDEEIKKSIAEKTKIHINPTGKFEIGGFEADTGLTGRKLAIDNYGPQVPIGGGCFSGKDPSKVDRSGAYMARKIAVDYLKKYNAEEVLVKLAYIIGLAQPAMATAFIKTQEADKIVNLLEENKNEYDLTPKGIIEFLDLKKPIYIQTSKYGHFGHKFRWEKEN
ncbi:MAG: methionine adenosyltransferase [bacterium]